jgi:DNA-binding LacI/PurR family transcriptional regulator
MPDRAPRLIDVAARAGVSHQTVSRVLNDSDHVREETRSKVLEAVTALGYRRNFAARTLATRRSGRLGVVSAHLGERGPATLASFLQESARAVGYEVAFVGLDALTPAALAESVDRLMAQSVEAIIVGVTHRDSVTMVEGLDLPIPVVLVEGVRGDRPLTAGVAQRDGAALATRHLLELGHRSVAHLAGPMAWVEASERHAGWLQAHREHGASPGGLWQGDWTAESGFVAGTEMASTPGLTAVFVANDQMALGVLRALHEHGRRVPHDVSVVGFDDLPESAYFFPPLTTVRQDFAEVARRAVQMTIRALAGEDVVADALIVPRLVERSSTAPASAPRPPKADHD